ncbi:protein cornichon homolog 4 [Condylostylus longicornis]|uniref:protein cornichon homolog 4 n=1 Tax=Condylostylus longicornis TaxID=2530218 RepID=UPI00244DF4DC|nr:protein cornichon homolog 4 [Condylostylus longicornis]
MINESLIFCVGLVIFAAILFLLIYYILTFADLECDYLNVRECCNRLNFWVIPKFGVHAILCVLLLLGGHWIIFGLNAPMVIWLGLELYKRPRDSLGVYDPVDIHSRGLLKIYLRNCLIYLGYYFIMFFIFLYCFISSLLKGDPIRRHENDEIVTEF